MWLKLLLTLLLFCYFTDGFPKLQVIEKGLSDDTMHSHIKYNKEEPKISSAEKSKEYWQNIANEILDKQRKRVPNTREPDDDFHSFIRYHKGEPKIPSQEKTKEYWQDVANKILDKQRKRIPNTSIAKNVIMFLGDGMSLSTLAAARVYVAKNLNHANGEEFNLSFEEFPYSGLSKTYCIDAQVADSACSATAFLCGIKANSGTIGVSGNVPLKDCKGMNNTDNHVDSILHLSQLVGKRTGIVTTTALTDASPAGAYGHTAYRNWENDADVKKDQEDPEMCRDLAYQLVHLSPGANVNVILGGGYEHLIPKDQKDPFGNLGRREDGEDLIESWKRKKGTANHEHVYNREQLLNIPDNTEFLLGLFNTIGLPYNLEKDAKKIPSIPEMTEAAIKILSKEEKGYFLFVEAGHVDIAHHQSKARVALDETSELHKAVEKALSMVNISETLIVVTSDHSHTMSISGYPDRGNNILGYGGVSGVDKKYYTTLGYANGPGYRKEDEGGRVVPTEEELAQISARYPGLVPLSSETHGGDDVGIYSIGPYSHFLDRMVEQNFIARVMMYASCVGSGPTACTDKYQA